MPQPQPQHNLDVGTLGPNPCQIALNKFLIELDDPHITKKVTSRYHDLREGLKKLECIEPRGFCITIMQMYYQRHIDIFEAHKDKMPKDVFTYSRCCYKMLLKQAIKRVSVQ